jgi:HK97 family phage major capsid protein
MSSIYEIERLLKEIGQELPPGLKARLEKVESQLKTRKWANLPGLEDEKDKFSLFRAIRAIRYNDWTGAEKEREVFKETRRRALGTGDDVAGGYLVPAQAIPELVEQLRAETVVIQMGATVISDLVGSPLMIPKQTTGATAYWITENAPITPSEQKFGQIQMTPKKCAAMVKLSNELLKMSNPAAEGIVRADLSQQLSLAVDLAALRGSGTENQPLGIANTENINTVSDAGALSSLDPFIDMAYEVEVDNALRGKLGYIFHPGVRRALRKLRVPAWSGDTGGDYMINLVAQALMSGDRAIQESLGYPFACTTQIPVTLGGGAATEVYFGNWADLLIAQWAGITLMASGEAGDSFLYDQVWIRAILGVDIALRHQESFCLWSDLTLS